MGADDKVMEGNPLDLDELMVRVGQFGRYQKIIFCLLSMPVMFSSIFNLAYVFTAAQVPHRCFVPECENRKTEFNSPWLSNAVPFEQYANESIPSQCLRYGVLDDNCNPDSFTNKTKECDDWVFEGMMRTIATEFKLTCEENRWKLTLVGTINNLGQFVGFPITGAFSDRYGRKTTLVVAICLSSLLGLARSFSPSYLVFLILEFLEPMLGIGIFSSAFVLSVELVGPKKRVLAGTIVSCFYAFGETILGVTAYWVRTWRALLRVLYGPALLFISYYWLLPESVRWLMSKHRVKEARKVLMKVAKTNGVNVKEELVNNILMVEGSEEDDEDEPTETIMDIFRSKILLVRVIICALCWLTNTFVFFGLALNSVSMGKNVYSNFILVAMIEIPAYVATFIIMDRWGRKKSQCLSLTLAGVSCIGFMFLPRDMVVGRLLLFMSGKFAITVSFTVLYVYTTEMFPTQLRHSLLGFCAMIGRLGSMLAPQTPILERYMDNLPLLLFGLLSLGAGFLSLTFPETLNAKMPDTILEAEWVKGDVRSGRFSADMSQSSRMPPVSHCVTKHVAGRA